MHVAQGGDRRPERGSVIPGPSPDSVIPGPRGDSIIPGPDRDSIIPGTTKTPASNRTRRRPTPWTPDPIDDSHAP